MAKILIADDAIFMRITLKNLLTDHGFEVVAEAENGAEAVDLYKAHNPDIVTMDITMPQMDGLTAVRKIMEFNPKAKIIIVSAMGQHALVTDALLAGAKDFIVKPFNTQRVVDSINKVMKMK